jgi:mono/diheme cytochrome c family protein
MLALTACHGERTHGAVPIDTAASLPTMDTATRAGADTAHLIAPADTANAGTSTTPAAPSIVLLADSAAGDTIFHEKGRCFTCHGQRGEGTARLGPNLADTTWLNGTGSLAAIRGVIANGVAVPKAFSVAMPAYAGMLTADEIARVASFVYTLSHPGAAVADTAAPADTSAMPRDTGTAAPHPTPLPHAPTPTADTTALQVRP